MEVPVGNWSQDPTVSGPGATYSSMDIQQQDTAVELDFAALLHYPGPRACSAALRRLEHGSPFEMRKVLQVWNRIGDFGMDLGKACWFETFGEGHAIPRPRGISIQASLETREGFSLAFGRDAVLVYHPLRWQHFLSDPEWTRVMLLACAGLGRELGADEFIVTPDEGPAALAFLREMHYEECLSESSQHERERVALGPFLRADDLTTQVAKTHRRLPLAVLSV